MPSRSIFVVQRAGYTDCGDGMPAGQRDEPSTAPIRSYTPSDLCYSSSLSFYWSGNTPTPQKFTQKILNQTTHTMTFTPPVCPTYPGPVMVRVAQAGAKYVSIGTLHPWVLSVYDSRPLDTPYIYVLGTAFGDDPSLVSVTILSSTGSIGCAITSFKPGSVTEVLCTPQGKPGVGNYSISVSVTRNGVVYPTLQPIVSGKFNPVFFDNDTNLVPVTSKVFQIRGEGFTTADSVLVALPYNCTSRIVEAGVIEVTLDDMPLYSETLSIKSPNSIKINGETIEACSTCRTQAVVSFYPVVYPGNYLFNTVGTSATTLPIAGRGFNNPLKFNYVQGSHTSYDWLDETSIEDNYVAPYCGAVRIRQFKAGTDGISNPTLPADPVTVGYALPNTLDAHASSFSFGTTEMILSTIYGAFNPNIELMSATLAMNDFTEPGIPTRITYVSPNLKSLKIVFDPLNETGFVFLNFTCEGALYYGGNVGEVQHPFHIYLSTATFSIHARRFSITGLNFGTDPSDIVMSVTAPFNWAGFNCSITLVSLSELICTITTEVVPLAGPLTVQAYRRNYNGSALVTETVGELTDSPPPILYNNTQTTIGQSGGDTLFVWAEEVGTSCSPAALRIDLYSRMVVDNVVSYPHVATCDFPAASSCFPDGPFSSGPGRIQCTIDGFGTLFQPGPLYGLIQHDGLLSEYQQIATVVLNPEVIEDLTTQFLQSSTVLTFRARRTAPEAETQAKIVFAGDTYGDTCIQVSLSTPDPSGVVTVTCTLNLQGFDLREGDAYAMVSRGPSFGAPGQIGISMRAPIFTIIDPVPKYATELATTGNLFAYDLGPPSNSPNGPIWPNLTVVFTPSGTCDEITGSVYNANWGYLTFNECHFPTGVQLYATISAFGGLSHSRYIADTVPAPTVTPANRIFLATAGEAQNVTFFGSFDPTESLTLKLELYLTTPTTPLRPLLPVAVYFSSGNTVSVLVELKFAGNISAYISQFGSYGNPVQVGTVFFCTTQAPIVSRKNLIATNAYQLKIYGDNFDPSEIPDVTLVWWPGEDSEASYEYIQQSDIDQIPIGCDVENWGKTFILCNIFIPPAPPKQGVLFALIHTYNRDSTPAVVASFTDPPAVTDTTSSRISISSPEISIFGTGFDDYLAEVVVTLSDGTMAPIVRIKPNEFVVVKVDLRVYAASQSGELKLISLNLHSYGADAQGTVGTIVNPSSFTPPSFTKIATSVRRLSFSGSGFGEAVADNEIRFWLDLGAEGNFTFSCPSIEAASLSKTSMTCLFPVENPITSHPGAVGLYFQIWTFGGPADAPISKRTAPSPGWTYLAPVVPAPAITVVADLDLPELEISDSTQVTISGANFDASGATTSVEFVGSETECQIASIAETSIVCTLTGTLLSGSLTAVVSSFQGDSNQAKVATLIPPPESNAAVVAPAVAVPLGVLVIAGAIVGGIFLSRWLRRRRLRSLMTAKASKFREDEKAYNEMNDLTTRARLAQEALRPYEIPKDKVEFGKELGAGAFGKVYLGKYDGKKIAIKQAQFVDDVAREAFLQEAKLMLGLEPHRNVVRTWGIIIEADSNYYLVLEYLAGSLDKIIYSPENHSRLTEADLIGFAKGIAQGMAHLASQKLVHRDLAVRNVLLSKDQTCKISDFGMSRRLEEQKAVGRTSGNVGPIFWMSPEALNQTYSEKSDVWAYGVTLFEIVSGTQPFLGLEILEAALLVRDKGANPGVPQRAPKLLAKLMEECWAVNPDDRPTFEQICKKLD